MRTRAYAAGRVVVVWLGGEWDMSAETTATLEFLASATSSATRHLVVDLSGMLFMGSFSLSCLIYVNRGEPRIGGALHLTGVDGNRVAARIIDLTGVRPLFDIRPDLDELLVELGAA